MQNVDSYYQRGGVKAPPRPALTGGAHAGTVIIGGGLAGLTLARELALAGQRPLLIEAGEVAFGASGRNGGFVSPGFACGFDAIRRRAGAETADELFRLSLEGVDYVRDRAAEAGPDAGIAPQDGIMSVRRRPAADSLHEEQDWLAERGYHTEYLDREAVQARARSPRYHQALRSDRSFHIHPLNYARALAVQAEAAGAVIHENSPATGLSRAGLGKHLVQTPRGRVTADRVVVATGGYTGALVPRLRSAFVPVATYVMASEPAPDLLAQAITTTDAIGDDRRAGNYYRLVDGGARLLWGGGISVTDRNHDAVIAHLRDSLLDTYPQLAPLRFDTAWSGWMSYARHQMPQIGALQDGIWYLTAFGGHGLNTTAMAARLLAEALTGASDRWRLFAPWGLDWAGGPLGRIAAQATYHWLGWQDRRRETRAA